MARTRKLHMGRFKLRTFCLNNIGIYWYNIMSLLYSWCAVDSSGVGYGCISSLLPGHHTHVIFSKTFLFSLSTCWISFFVSRFQRVFRQRVTIITSRSLQMDRAVVILNGCNEQIHPIDNDMIWLTYSCDIKVYVSLSEFVLVCEMFFFFSRTMRQCSND